MKNIPLNYKIIQIMAPDHVSLFGQEIFRQNWPQHIPGGYFSNSWLLCHYNFVVTLLILHHDYSRNVLIKDQYLNKIMWTHSLSFVLEFGSVEAVSSRFAHRSKSIQDITSRNKKNWIFFKSFKLTKNIKRKFFLEIQWFRAGYKGRSY